MSNSFDNKNGVAVFPTLKNPPIQETALGITFDMQHLTQSDVESIVEKIDKEFRRFAVIETGSVSIDAASGEARSGKQWSGARYKKGENIFLAVQNIFPSKASKGVIFSFNITPPYVSWKMFCVELLSVLNSFVEQTGATKISRIGVRTIDRLKVPSKPVAVNAILTTVLPDIKGLSAGKIRDFYLRDTIYYEQYDLFVTTVRSTMPTEAEKPPEIILDTDVFSPVSAIFSKEWLDEILHRIHILRDTVFFGTVAEKYLEAYK